MRRPRSLRWLVVLIASLLLHALGLTWATHRVVFPSWPARDQRVVTTELRFAAESPVALNAPPVSEPPPPKPRPKPKAPPRPAPEPEPVPSAMPDEAPSVPLAAADAAGDAASLPDPGDHAAPPIAAAADDVPASDHSALPPPETAPVQAAQAQPESPRTTAYRIDPPPSAELKYEVRASKNGQTTYGSGKIRWESAGGRYAVNGETSVLFFTVLDFHSEGSIDENGIAPVLYSEKRFRRAQTNTHFNRERNAISFSASTASYPRQGGEQDRASIVWQLAAIGRGNGSQFHPDAQFEIFVAGTRDGEPWRIRVIGQETIQVGLGEITAWHLVRLPRPKSYDQKLDIWLAPNHQWYPVRIQFTEASGDALEMSLSEVNLTKAE